MAYTCLFVLFVNLYCKYRSETLIFMFNPCHFTNMMLILVGFLRKNLFTELLALYIFSSAFGGWIGIIFSENEELHAFEIFIYYVEHAYTSFLGPLVLSLSGRFDPLDYFGLALPICGFHLFCVYMRWILTPLSLIFWANLNHNLCGVDNDPFFANFFPDYTYYAWADLYLLFSCYVGLILNFTICYTVKVVKDIMTSKIKVS